MRKLRFFFKSGIYCRRMEISDLDAWWKSHIFFSGLYFGLKNILELVRLPIYALNFIILIVKTNYINQILKKWTYTPNRIRQIFQSYVKKAGLDWEYGTDSKSRRLHKFTIHSLRHTHCMHYIHIYKLPIPIVQRQVGHTTLDATMTYCRPTDEFVGKFYNKARAKQITERSI